MVRTRSVARKEEARAVMSRASGQLASYVKDTPAVIYRPVSYAGSPATLRTLKEALEALEKEEPRDFLFTGCYDESAAHRSEPTGTMLRRANKKMFVYWSQENHIKAFHPHQRLWGTCPDCSPDGGRFFYGNNPPIRDLYLVGWGGGDDATRRSVKTRICGALEAHNISHEWSGNVDSLIKVKVKPLSHYDWYGKTPENPYWAAAPDDESSSSSSDEEDE